MTAAGCNLLAFTTGRGTTIASPLAPTIKITANEATYERMSENIDFLAKSEDVGDGGRLLEAIVAYAAGTPTKGEIVGHTEMFIPLEGVTF
jgi:altronate dehydratase